MENVNTTRPDSAPSAPREAASVSAAPWDRFGWVMAVIWLFFLGFPISDVLDRSGWERIAGLAVITIFAAIYTTGFVRFPRLHPSQRLQNLTLIALVVVAGVGALITGPVALTLVPFITAFGVYYQPPRRSIALSGIWILLTAAVLTLTNTWSTLGIMLVIVALVAVVTFVPRWLDDQQQAHIALRAEYTRIAEQERVARDVHDVLGHSLTVIAVKAELAGRLLERVEIRDPEVTILDDAAREVAAIESLSRQALSEIRATVAGLRVARLDTELANAVGVLDTAGVKLETIGDPEMLDPRHRLVAGWVLREAVTNVVRHARAKTCRIEIGSHKIAVSDDGCGVDPSASGSGIPGLRERVRMSGGKFSIQQNPVGGTELEAHW